MPNRGRPKALVKKVQERAKPEYITIRQRIYKEEQLICGKLRAAGYFVWKQVGAFVWRTRVSGINYEIHAPREGRGWCVLPVNRSIARDRIISLINKALSEGSGNGSDSISSSKA